jgi:hypothetical protein
MESNQRSSQQKGFFAALASALPTGLNLGPDDFALLFAPANTASAKSGCRCLHTVPALFCPVSSEAALLTG